MRHRAAGLAIAMLLFVVLACNLSKKSTNVSNDNSTTSANTKTEAVSTSTGVLTDVHMARDDGSGDPGEQTSVFSASDRTIHCVTKLKEPNAGTKMKFSWYVVEAGDTKNEKIKDIDYTTRRLENVVHGHLTAPRDWPVGKYRVEVYVNGNLEQTVSFAVE